MYYIIELSGFGRVARIVCNLCKVEGLSSKCSASMKLRKASCAREIAAANAIMCKRHSKRLSNWRTLRWFGKIRKNSPRFAGCL